MSSGIRISSADSSTDAQAREARANYPKAAKRCITYISRTLRSQDRPWRPARSPFHCAPLSPRIAVAPSTCARTSRLNKKTPTRREPAARAITRRLIADRGSNLAQGETPARAAAAAADHLYQELSRWVGADGCHALFTRALAKAHTSHPSLQNIQLRARSQPYVDGIAATIMAHGDAATAEAVESMLVHLVELLGRLIGEDMATKLIERSLNVPRRDSNRGGTQEEA